jgi:UDP-glucose 4-epimerase
MVRQVVKTLCSTTGLRPKVLYRPILGGVGWAGDVKGITLDITKLKSLGFRPVFSSAEAVRQAVDSLMKELFLVSET